MAQAGWYESPGEPGMLRYWSGSAWTDARQPAAPVGEPTIVPNNGVERMLLELRDLAEAEKSQAAAGDVPGTTATPAQISTRVTTARGGASTNLPITPDSPSGVGFSFNLGSLGGPGRGIFLGLFGIVGGFMLMGMAQPVSPPPLVALAEHYEWTIPVLGAVVLVASTIWLFARSGTFLHDAGILIDKLRGRSGSA